MGPPSLDLAKDPLILFGAVPPMPPGANLPLPAGSADFFDLFSPGADWTEAAGRIDVFKLHAWQVRHYLNDAQLRLILTWLHDNRIPLMFESEPLQPPDPDECDHTESFEGPYDLEMARRIKDLGGTIAVVAIEEPYAFAHKLEGPGACRYSVERIVDEVLLYVSEMRLIFPDVPVGSIEPIWQSPATTPADMELWLDTYQEQAGEPFAFLHIDPDWTRPDWAQVALEIEALADERGIPFGVLYNGGHETDAVSWLQATIQHVADFEAIAGGSPQHVAFQSWVDQPDRVLPDDDLGAFTSIINRYYGTPTTMRVEDEAGEITAELVDAAGAAMSGEPVRVALLPLAGAAQLHTTSGLVPDAAQAAVIAIRVNVEDATPGEADVFLSSVEYEENGDGTNLVSNSGFADGLRDWGVYGDRLGDARVIRDDAGNRRLSLVADRSERIWIDSTPFPVTPGAPYDFRAAFGVPEESIGTATVSVVFLADSEVQRRTIRFEPEVLLRPPEVTDDAGKVYVDTGDVPPGRYEIVVSYGGTLSSWPSRAALVRDIG